MCNIIRRYLNLWILVIFSHVTQISCQVEGPKPSDDDALYLSALSPARRDHPWVNIKCPFQEKICTEQYDPVFCTASSYGGRSISPDQGLIAWGENSCIGYQKLLSQICQNRLNPAAFEGVQCVPDSSGGNCPPPLPKCLNEKSSSIVCSASHYADQRLKPEQHIKGRGNSQCQAEYALRMAACRANLNPTALSQVNCITDPTGDECWEKAKVCADKVSKTKCSGQLKNSGQTLETVGDSECSTRHQLGRLACQYDQPPSSLNNINCHIYNGL